MRVSGQWGFQSLRLKQTKPSFFWPLRLIAAVSLLAPALLFGYWAWQNRLDIDRQVNERIERALDVLQEHALKALQTVELTISETNEVLRGLADDEVRAREAELHRRLMRTQKPLPQIGAIWVFDADGRPLVSSRVVPVPAIEISARGYFAAQKEADAGPYLSEVIRPGTSTGPAQLIMISGRRELGEPARFAGIIGISVAPEHFSEFYGKLSRGRDIFALIRSDGRLLARFPDAQQPDSGRSIIADLIKDGRESGITTARSTIDGGERRLGFRRVPGFPVYVAAGVETSAISGEYWSTTLRQFLLGLPFVLAMFALTIYALRRAERYEAETVRREAAEAALKQAQRLEAVGQLTGGVAHDFNNLLMVVRGNAERIGRIAPSDDRLKRSLEAIEIAVTRGASLTRQLLSFSRRQTHEARIIDLNERLPAIREMLQASLRGDIVVEAHIPADLWHTKVDISEFELALLNLAVNARDAMKNGGRLTIAARNIDAAAARSMGLDGEFIVVSVSDTGEGIPPELLGRVFEPFFTTKEVGKGTGLGLSQVYGFAQQAGGSVTIGSQLGKGATVSLYLPRADAPADRPAAATAVVDRRGKLRGRVLLVEDNPHVSEVTRSLLEEFGYLVVQAPDVATAKDVLSRDDEGGIGIVLSDIVMPGGANGLDLARWITAQHGARLPVILATGYSDSAQEASNEGFRILRKPYDGAQLRDALAEGLRRSRTRDGDRATAVAG